MQFLFVDGEGAPESDAYGNAVGWLYGVSYPIKFASKAKLDQDYTVMPLEGLWWTPTPAGFSMEDKSAWEWTAMMVQPEPATVCAA